MQTHIQTYDVLPLVDGVFSWYSTPCRYRSGDLGRSGQLLTRPGRGGGGDVPDKGPLFVHLTSPYAMFTIEYKFVRHRVINASVCLASWWPGPRLWSHPPPLTFSSPTLSKTKFRGKHAVSWMRETPRLKSARGCCFQQSSLFNPKF